MFKHFDAQVWWCCQACNTQHDQTDKKKYHSRPGGLYKRRPETTGYIKQNKSRNQYKSTIDKYKVRHIVSFFVGTVFTDECSPKKREYQQENGYNRS